MTNFDLREQFSNIIDNSRVDLASADPDLVAFYELRMNGYTEAVPLKRAELLEEYDEDQLHDEVQRGYYLTRSEVPRVIAKCVGHIANVQVGFSSK